MPDNNLNLNDHINKRDLEIILEVNKKAIEIETEVAEQNEEIITLLQDSKKREEDLQKKLEMTYEEVEDIKKDSNDLSNIHAGLFCENLVVFYGLEIIYACNLSFSSFKSHNYFISSIFLFISCISI